MEVKNKERCGWVTNDEIYINYHDTEWGEPVFEDKKLFEMLLLEGFQAGLSWITILKKRENFRQAFDNFNYTKIATYNQTKLEELLHNTGIIRNRLKIESSVKNAKAFIKVREEFGTFSQYIWRFVEHQPIKNEFKNLSEVPVSTPLSDKISKDLKKRGFKFVGTTIIYAFMQAIGMVNDHVQTCYKHPKNLN
ncbi:DNA-3-methyladenine glycosylase I [Riemerella anatipestifer]|uniref:DNA-3-methyladenine glycosylase I n=1 Tax=Riemerella anatipestifer (strain ATCC 11845 / DSM 15868 / JCM 9532 / NCTC 11014) TaxID=693978 RepID=E4TBA6_RIEAD|nr:DNA-3-methyladenine glycosylase I [Riemerella anatipestifer]ADQ81410.1 DNA-3-methyladenine glycosylase I [Riemerella anatipestifer ATCC 11845 = DSM 15868]ADZ13095.1 3-methyladenine DNA glycosylase [Riemerella anatipestifer RA-GD]AFD55424.1 DNAgene-methyladenine glycosylase i [Riemerella anatipestifer ATCC 11845 = DSM 15868]AGC40694.1 3-methyladenine DNA glycosylase [Riemerella anatipestifer RA-CH-2]AKP68690.1 DNA-3-methyladenine glycosylase i [Riemerella anatipestifer]